MGVLDDRLQPDFRSVATLCSSTLPRKTLTRIRKSLISSSNHACTPPYRKHGWQAAQHKGFDDIAAAAPAEPPLTTIYNPLYEMGGTAVIRSST
jgi:hypothetical protein